MSEGEVDITFRIGALRITVQGPLDLCVDAQRRIADCLGADSPPPASSVPSRFSFVNPPPTAPASHQAPATEPEPSVPESRSDVVASFPPLPNCWASLAGQLHSASSSGSSRLARAWVAGHWARATLEGRVPSPAHSPVLKIPAQHYVVLRAPSVQQPVLVSSSRAYFDLVGRPFHPSSLSHSFPSLLEAKVYCDAAGVDFPQRR